MAADAYGQQLEGTARLSDGGNVEGVLLQLLDSRGQEVRRALLTSTGTFTLRAPERGVYRIRAMRIGYRPFSVGPYELESGQSHQVALMLTATPLRLDAVRVVDDAVCSAVGNDSRLAFALWDQVRTALGAAEITGSRPFDATVLGYERTLERNFRVVRDQRSWVRTAPVKTPWRAVPLEALSARGYVNDAAGDSVEFHAPGLEALQSDVFIAQHCLRVIRSGTGDSLGIAFSPTPQRSRIPEIAGVAYVDPQSLALRRIEFRYVHVPNHLAGARGEMDFARLPGGLWIVSHWSIAMPQAVTYETPVGTRARLAYLRVSGGRVLTVARRSDTLWRHPPLLWGGFVLDSASGRPLDAQVSILGTDARVATGTRGEFVFHNVVPGEYDVSIRTRALDSLGIAHVARGIVGDSAAPQTIRVPSAEQLALALCGRQSFAWKQSDRGILLGRVSVREDSLPPGTTRVVVQWRREIDPLARSSAVSVPSGHEGAGKSGMSLRMRADDEHWTTSDDRGFFRVCGVPLNTDLYVQAALGADSASTTVVRLEGRQRLRRVEIVVNRSSLLTATFAGRVLVAGRERPIVEAEVFLPELQRGDYTDSLGAFEIRNVSSGRHSVIVRRIGYLPLDTALTFEAGQVTQRSIYLHDVQTMESVDVVERALTSFDEHQRLGLGQFLTADDIAARHARALADVLAQMPGAAVTRRGGRNVILSSRGPRSFSAHECPVQVYLDRMLMFAGREGEEPFDINVIPVERVAAIEFYSSPARVPRRYMGLNTHCGVLVIHTDRD